MTASERLIAERMELVGRIYDVSARLQHCGGSVDREELRRLHTAIVDIRDRANRFVDLMRGEAVNLKPIPPTCAWCHAAPSASDSDYCGVDCEGEGERVRRLELYGQDS